MLLNPRIAGNLLVASCMAVALWSCAPPRTAPEFDLEKVTGGRVRSADLKGKVVVVDFWATWCVPCKVEIPHYNELIARMKGKNFAFIGVTFDAETAKDVEPYIEDLKISYPITMGNEDVNNGFGGEGLFPTTFLVGKDWKVYAKWEGATPGKIQELEDGINLLLAE
jgi:thiol-disulfide isomerase/thioredoxin